MCIPNFLMLSSTYVCLISSFLNLMLIDSFVILWYLSFVVLRVKYFVVGGYGFHLLGSYAIFDVSGQTESSFDRHFQIPRVFDLAVSNNESKGRQAVSRHNKLIK